MKRMMSSSPAKLQLTDNERLIFRVFLDTCRHFQLKTTLRAAGGWVRDKLLDIASDDIDIAVDAGTGEDFADKVEQYAKAVQGAAKTNAEGAAPGIDGEPVRLAGGTGVPDYANKLQVSSVGSVRKNPEQSKHLATACFRICGVSIDVTNLRTETYAEESGRIPVIEIGTPEEDAHRRDLTINALFYNLNEDRVEDFTGRGVTDLTNGFIRTPLDPEVTFLDDPLRVLRVVRFACRYDFEMDPLILEACLQAKVQRTLEQRKVSAERMGIEFEKIMKHANSPLRALQYFMATGILEPILKTGGAGKRERSSPVADRVGGARGNGAPHQGRLWLERYYPHEGQGLLLPSASRMAVGSESGSSCATAGAAGEVVSGGRGSGGSSGTPETSPEPPKKRAASQSWREFVPKAREPVWQLPQPQWWQLVGYAAIHALEQRLQLQKEVLMLGGDLRASVRFAALLLSFGASRVPEGKKHVDEIYAILWQNLVIKKATSEGAAGLARTALAVFLPELVHEGVENSSSASKAAVVNSSVAGQEPAGGTHTQHSDKFVRLGYALRERKDNWKLALFLAEAAQIAVVRAETMEATPVARCGLERQTQEGKDKDDATSDVIATTAQVHTIDVSAASLRRLAPPVPPRSPSPSSPAASLANFEAEVRRNTDRLIADIEGHGLNECWKWVATFTGDRLRKEFDVGKGPVMGELIKAQIEWRMEKPKITEDEVRIKLNAKLGRAAGDNNAETSSPSACGENKNRTCCGP